MNTDVRISVNFFSHRKTARLQKALGVKGVLGLIKLWCDAAVYNPKGDISDLTDDELEVISGYHDGEKFRQTLLDIGFLRMEDGITVIHNWEKHNGWAYHAAERSELAKRKAKIKWEKYYADSMQNAGKESAPNPAPETKPQPKPRPSTEAVASYSSSTPFKANAVAFEEEDNNIPPF